jgi:hypothetical protein
VRGWLCERSGERGDLVLLYVELFIVADRAAGPKCLAGGATQQAASRIWLARCYEQIDRSVESRADYARCYRKNGQRCCANHSAQEGQPAKRPARERTRRALAECFRSLVRENGGGRSEPVRATGVTPLPSPG